MPTNRPTIDKPFRRHDAAPTTSTDTLFGALALEWVDLNASRQPAATVQRWASQYPELGGATRPADIVDAVDAAGGTHQDAILLRLLQLAHDGEQLAGRILLQQMLPKLARLSNPEQVNVPRTASELRDWEDRRSILVATFWEVLATYPIQRRPSKVAANLALDTLGKYRRSPEMQNQDFPLSAPGEYFPMDTPTEPHPIELDQVLTWAVTNDVLAPTAAHMLTAIYEHGESTADYAARTGNTYAAIRKQCSRARRRLSDALLELQAS